MTMISRRKLLQTVGVGTALFASGAYLGRRGIDQAWIAADGGLDHAMIDVTIQFRLTDSQIGTFYIV